MNNKYIIKNASEENQMPKIGRLVGDYLPLADKQPNQYFEFNPADKKRIDAAVHSFGNRTKTVFIISMKASHGEVWRVS